MPYLSSAHFYQQLVLVFVDQVNSFDFQFDHQAFEILG